MKKIAKDKTDKKRNPKSWKFNKVEYSTIYSFSMKGKKSKVENPSQYKFLPPKFSKREGYKKEIISIASVLKKQTCLRSELANELIEFNVDSLGESMQVLSGIITNYKRAVKVDENNDGENRAKKAKKFLKMKNELAHLLFPETERSKAKGISSEGRFEEEFGDLTKALKKIGKRPKKQKGTRYIPTKTLIQEMIRFLDSKTEHGVPKHSKTHSAKSSSNDQRSGAANRGRAKIAKKRTESECFVHEESQLVFEICKELIPDIKIGNVSTVLKERAATWEQFPERVYRDAEMEAKRRKGRMTARRRASKALQDPYKIIVQRHENKALEKVDRKYTRK